MERTRTSDVGQVQRDDVQMIGDRTVTNLRIRVAHLRDADDNILETVKLSLEVCGCGYSYARAGVGYRGDDGWHCKRCGQLHTQDAGNASSTVDHATLRPVPALVREFDRRTTGASPHRSTAFDLEASH